jgi:hypothetical protein
MDTCFGAAHVPQLPVFLLGTRPRKNGFEFFRLRRTLRGFFRTFAGFVYSLRGEICQTNLTLFFVNQKTQDFFSFLFHFVETCGKI